MYDNVNRNPISNNQQAMEDYYGEYFIFRGREVFSVAIVINDV